MYEVALKAWRPDSKSLLIKTIDVHTGGEPFRIIVDGFPPVEGATMLERREYALSHHDSIRKALMLEPRGHADMYGCILTPPASPDSDLGVLFMHNAGYSTMCGHGIIGLVTVLVECGLVPAVDPHKVLKIDTPAGTVEASAEVVDNQRVQSVSFLNVPSFVVCLDDEIEVPGIGTVPFDLAFGGAYYAYVDAKAIGLTCEASNVERMISVGRSIKRAFQQQRSIAHPFDRDMSFLYGVIFTERYKDSEVFGKNVCVFADGEVDRSPTGTGVSGRLALHYERGEITLGEEIRISSIIGSEFTGSVADTLKFGPYDAITPNVGGQAFVTGLHEFVLNPTDEIGKGFMLR